MTGGNYTIASGNPFDGIELEGTFTTRLQANEWADAEMPNNAEWWVVRIKQPKRPLWENDLIQFARLISEIRATCSLQVRDWADLQASMDLDEDDVNELFERANDVWEASKAALPTPEFRRES